MALSIRLQNSQPVLDFAARIPAGQLSAMVGPSGSGKTSVLRAIAGLIACQQEEVRFGDDTWSDSSQRVHRATALRPVGMVAQNYALFPHLNALDNVRLALSAHSSQEQDRLARHYLNICHVNGLESRYPHQLSGGQKQRVALARALARRPDILLLDEPFSAVDKVTRSRLYNELRQLHKELGMTIVLVTHDLQEAQYLASHLLLVNNGRCVQQGPLQEVMRFPSSHEAARVLNIPNIFQAVWTKTSASEGGSLQWGPYVMNTGRKPNGGEVGSQTLFAVLPQNMFLIPSQLGEKRRTAANPIDVVITDIIELDMEAIVWVRPKQMMNTKILVRIPQRAVGRYALATGEEVVISILPDDILPLSMQ